MRKGISVMVLLVVSLIALNVPIFTAFASEPNVVITPDTGLTGESFNFDITATSYSTLSGIEVEDPEGNSWTLKGLTRYGWRTVKIWLPDAGDKIRLKWPEASFSVLNDPDHDVKKRSTYGLSITDLAWMNGKEKVPHTQLMGTYSLSFSGYGCVYFYVASFFVVPEGMLGTLSFLLICFASFVIIYARTRNLKSASTQISGRP